MRASAVAALVAVLVAAAVRLPGLGARGLASAEQAAFVESRGLSTATPLPSGRPLAPAELPRRATPPPLDAAALGRWISLAGASETALRLPSAVAGVLAAGTAALVAGQVAGPWAAAWAGGLVAVSPIHVLASRQAGPEAPLVLVLLAALALVGRLERSGGRASSVALGLALALLAASGVAAFAGLAVLLPAWLALRADRRPAAGLAATVAAGLAAVAALLGLARSPLDFGEIPSWVPETTLSGLARCTGASFTRVAGLEYHLAVSHARHVAPLTALFVGLMAWGASRLPGRERGLAVAGAALPFLLGAALALAAGRVTPLQATRLVAALPFLVLLTASGLASLRGRRAWAAGAVAGGALLAFLALALARPAYEDSPKRALAGEVARCRPEGTVVALQRPLDLLALAAWEVPGPLLLRAARAPLPAGPAIAVGPSSACVAGGATCGSLPLCPPE